MTLSSDVNNGTPTHRERRAMVFPSGTVLQVRSNVLSSGFDELSKLNMYNVPLTYFAK
jgi:hypothetical protein